MIKFTTFIILFIVFIVPALLGSQIKMIPADDQPGYGNMGRVSVYGVREFKQEFISKENNLTGVATTIKNPNLKNKKEIIFKLFDTDSNLIRTVTLNGFNIGDGDFVKFVFDPIQNTKGKQFYFNISSPDAGDEEIIELFLTGKTTEILNYTYGEIVKEGGVPLVTYHKVNSWFEPVKLIFVNLFSKLLHLGSYK